MSSRTQARSATPGALWRLARPAGMPLVLSLPLVGYGFGHWEWGLTTQHPTALLWLVAAWWFLSAGTLWLNAALDRDEGDVLMGRTEPVPGDIAAWGYGALVASVALGWMAGTVTALCAAGAALLAVGYSHPRLAWKGHPVLGPAVNLVGYGVLSPVAGWAVVGTEPTVRTLPALVLLVAWVGATYFGAQAFQQREDGARGYRTLVVTHGPAAAIGLARLGYAVAIWGGVALSLAGFLPRMLLLGLIPWWALDRHLAAWQAHPDDDGAARARGMLRRAVGVAVAVMVAVTVQHVWQCALGDLPAGLGTAWSPIP